MNFFKNILFKINQHTEKTAHPYALFGIFGIITYPVYYFIWVHVGAVGYENLYLRSVVILLCIPLIFNKYWPGKLKELLPIYWYFTLLYALPFLFTFLLLKNGFSHVWTLNALTVIVLSVLLLDFIPLMIILPLGIGLGILVYHFTTSAIPLVTNYASIVVTYLSVILFGALFARNKESIQYEKLKVMRSVGASIAHELRTPLGSISSGADGIKNYLPALIKVYYMAKKNNLPVPEIQPRHIYLLENELKNIEMETQYANTVINMLLIKINSAEASNTNLEKCLAAECINNALERYPFNSPEQIKLIHWENKEDFSFQGNTLFFIHVIFNLLKNALYYIADAGKGEIYIWLEKTSSTNIVHFKDTGKGISPKVLPHIFKLFFTQTRNGTGIGLAFCKIVMKSFNGTIICKSVEGKFTEFLLSFPK